MKIFVNARFLTQPVSGVQRYGIECSRQIKKLHKDVVFVSPGNIIHLQVAEELDAKVIGRNTGHFWEQIDLPRYVSAQGSAPLLNLANTAPLTYRNNFVTIHDLAFRHHPGWNSRAFAMWYNFLLPKLAHNSRHIFTVSLTIRDEIAAAYNIAGDKISIAYNGISQKMLVAKRTVPKEKIILSVGTFNVRKNHAHLIAGYIDSGLCNEYELVLIGDKNKVFKGGGIDESTLEHTKIRIYPTLSEDDLINMYQRAEILASLSLYEGFGIPVLEGLYNGCKVICSDIPVYRELYNGYVSFCDPSDVANIAMTINNVVAKHGGRPDVSSLLGKYSYEASAQLMLAEIARHAK